VVEECEEVGAGIHGMNDDVSIVVTDDDNECDHGGCTVRTDERIARRVFVGIEIELYESIVEGVTDGVVGESVLAG
jgi:hypothetical protein